MFFLDCETTGLDPRVDELLELAIIDEAGSVIFHKRFKPERVLSWKDAQAVNGISPDDVSDAPSLKSMKKTIQEVCGDETLAAWNARFDKGFLSFLNNEFYCVMYAFDDYLTEHAKGLRSLTGRYKLFQVADDMGISYDAEKLHSAITDAEITRQIAEKISTQDFQPEFSYDGTEDFTFSFWRGKAK